MSQAAPRELIRTPVFRVLFVIAVLIGFRDALAEPYIVLFAIRDAQAGPLGLGLFLTVRALGAVTASLLFGLWFDRRPSPWPLALALAAGLAGALICTRPIGLPALLLVGGVPLAIGGAAFPQSFALSKAHLDRHGLSVSERGTAVLRSAFSVAWAIGPMIGGVAVSARGFHAIFAASALCGSLALGAVLFSRLRAPVPSARSPALALPGSRQLGWVTVAFVLFFTTLCMASAAMPIVMTEVLGGSTADVGIAASLCAGLEVPVMLAVALRPQQWGGYRGLVVGFIAMSLYFVAARAAPSPSLFILAQMLRALGIGLAACIGISYMQELMPGRAGAAAAVFTASGQVGALLAGVAVGGWADCFGYRSVFPVCALLCVTGLGFLVGSRRQALQVPQPA